jgi:hypothetical protein
VGVWVDELAVFDGTDELVVLLIGAAVVGGVGGVGGVTTGPHASPSCIGAAVEKTMKLESTSPLRTFLNEGIARWCVIEVKIVEESGESWEGSFR